MQGRYTLANFPSGHILIYMESAASWSDTVAARINAAIEDDVRPVHHIATESGLALNTLRRRISGPSPWTLREVEAVARALRKHPDTFTNGALDGEADPS